MSLRSTPLVLIAALLALSAFAAEGCGKTDIENPSDVGGAGGTAGGKAGFPGSGGTRFGGAGGSGGGGAVGGTGGFAGVPVGGMGGSGGAATGGSGGIAAGSGGTGTGGTVIGGSGASGGTVIGGSGGAGTGGTGTDCGCVPGDLTCAATCAWGVGTFCNPEAPFVCGTGEKCCIVSDAADYCEAVGTACICSGTGCIVTSFACDGAEDCPSGEICCAVFSNRQQRYVRSSCQAACGGNERELCHAGSAACTDATQSCSTSPALPDDSYQVCG